MKKTRVLKNENGSILVIALIMLVLLTILGISATTTSNVELQIANNERNYKRAFFIANAAIEQTRAILAQGLNNTQGQAISMGGSLNWSFALSNAEDPATGFDFGTGAKLLTDQSFNLPNAPGGYTYSVVIYNDPGEASATNDTNSLVIAEARVSGPNNVRACVAVRLRAGSTGEAINSYSAQQGGGSPKNYSSEDRYGITDANLATSQM
jgi:hypothetical protein